MAALPYIQLYVADYLADTMHLSTEEHGAYLLLIMNYWQTGRPIKEKHIQAITKVSNERLTDVINSLQHFFNVDKTTGLWTHYRIEKDLEKVRCKSIKASEAGKRSAKKRWGDNVNITNVITDVNKTLQRNCNHTDTNTYTDIKDKSITNVIDSFLSLDEDEKPEKQQKDNCPYQAIAKAYHEQLPELSTIQALNEKRKRQIKTLWKNHLKTLTEWENYFKFVRRSDFLMGKVQYNGRAPFKCSIDFLTNENNFLKICEDKYHG